MKLCLPASALWRACLAILATLTSQTCLASTIVQFDTSLGKIEVRLFDTATPQSVDNFLNYVNDGDFTDSLFHRSVNNFIIQGGGFTFPAGGSVTSVPTDPAVTNEPGLTNYRGTLAYAKLGGDPNSATSGWFFNLSDDNASIAPAMLDSQNGGFTVFGRVIGPAIQVVDNIANQQIVNAGGTFSDLPVLNSFSQPNVQRDDLIFVNSVQVINFLQGDYTFTGTVDLDDYEIWRSQFGNSLRIADHVGASPNTNMEADGNGDGVVDAADYTLWRDAFVASSAAVSSTGVPEPSTGLILGLISLLALASRRRA